MKIRVSKLFDEADIQDDKIREAIAPFIAHQNQVNDNIISALRKEITLTDNVKGSRVDIAMRHDTATTHSVSGSFIGAIPLFVETKDVGIESYTLRQPTSGQVEFKVQFTDTATTARTVRWYIFVD